MSAQLRRELEKLSRQLEALKKSYTVQKKIAPEVKLRRYHILLNRISKSPEVDITPDELISSLKKKEY